MKLSTNTVQVLKNFASIKFNNPHEGGAEVSIEWNNVDLKKIN